MTGCPQTLQTVRSYQRRLCLVGCLLIACFCLVALQESLWTGVRRAARPSAADSFTTLLLFCTRKVARQSGRAVSDDADADGVDGYRCEPLTTTVVRISSGPVKVKPEPEMSSVSLREQNKRLLRQVGGAVGRSLVTLFTTMKDTPLRDQIHRNTLANWAVLSPFVHPVLFVPTGQSGNESMDWAGMARKLGWHVVSAGRTIRNVPILREMFSVVSRDYDTPFIGYANADILFDGELPRTLSAILDSYGGDHALRKKMILLTGRRKNINVHYFKDGACLTCLEEIASRSKMFQSDAEDYFIVSRAGFPWKDVPDFIVGSPGYDNWLVAKAIKWQVDVIDGSRTINAVHQVNAEGIKSGWDFNKDPYVNLRMVPGSFNYDQGHCTCAPYRTIYSFKDCPPPLKSCVKLVQTDPDDIPDQCHETPPFTTDSYTYNFLDHDY